MRSKNTCTVVFNNTAVRALTPVTGTDVAIAGRLQVLCINNTLNQAGNYQVQYSYDGGTTWNNLGSAQALAANSGLSFVSAIGGAAVSPVFGIYRITYTASIAPTTGTLYMCLQTYYEG